MKINLKSRKYWSMKLKKKWGEWKEKKEENEKKIKKFC
jgi:hypothetical protein